MSTIYKVTSGMSFGEMVGQGEVGWYIQGPVMRLSALRWESPGMSISKP